MNIRDRIINKAVDLWCERLKNPMKLKIEK